MRSWSLESNEGWMSTQSRWPLAPQPTPWLGCLQDWERTNTSAGRCHQRPAFRSEPSGKDGGSHLRLESDDGRIDHADRGGPQQLGPAG